MHPTFAAKEALPTIIPKPFGRHHGDMNLHDILQPTRKLPASGQMRHSLCDNQKFLQGDPEDKILFREGFEACPSTTFHVSDRVVPSREEFLVGEWGGEDPAQGFPEGLEVVGEA